MTSAVVKEGYVQVRRGTAAQWQATGRVLALGEPGYITDSNTLVFGDGVTAPATSLVGINGVTPSALNAAISTAVNTLLGGAPAALDTFKEVADAIGDNPNFATYMQTQLAAKAAAMKVAAVKTGAYTANVAEIVPVDATNGAVPITLPTAPADQTRVVVKKIDSSTNTVTVSRGGSSDVFNKTGGVTSLTLSLTNQAVTVQYAAAVSIWYVVGDDLPYTALQAALQTYFSGIFAPVAEPVALTKRTRPAMLAAVTAASAPVKDAILPINCAGAAVTNVPLPALSAVSIGDTYWVEKSDTSRNPLVQPFATGDTTLDGATQLTFAMKGTAEIQAVANPSGTGKLWKVVSRDRADSTFDSRYVGALVADSASYGAGSVDATAHLNGLLATSGLFGIPVILPAGVYSALGLTIPAGAELRSLGGATVKAAVATSAATLVTIAGSDVTIDGVTFDGNASAQSLVVSCVAWGGVYSRVKINGCTFMNGSGYGVQCGQTNPTDITITDNRFVGFAARPAVQFSSGATRAIVSRNLVNGANYGISFAPGNTTYAYTDIKIVDNIVLGVTGIPIELQRGLRATVCANHVSGGGTNGVSVGYCDYLTVASNVISDQSNEGIEAGTGNHQAITGNTIANCAEGIAVNGALVNLTISGNVFRNMTGTTNGDCIRAGGPITNGVISDNVFTDPANGNAIVLLGGATDVSIADNIFKQSVGGGSAKPSLVTVSGGVRVVIEDNSFTIGVSLSGQVISFGGTNTDCAVLGNRIIGVTGSAVAQVGVGLQSGATVPYFRLARNRFSYLTTPANLAADTNSVIEVSGNRLDNCTNGFTLPTQAQLSITFTPRGTYDNTITYNYGDAVTFNGSSYVAVQQTVGNAPPGSQWQLLAAVGNPGPTGPGGYNASNYFNSGKLYSVGQTTGGATAMTNGQLIAQPFLVGVTHSFQQISVQVSSAGTAGSVLRLGIYSDNNGSPGALVADLGVVDGTTTGLKTVTVPAANQSFSPGLYWIAYAQQGAPTTPSSVFSNNVLGTAPLWGTASGVSSTGLVATGVTGALPATFPAAAPNANPSPRLFLIAA